MKNQVLINWLKAEAPQDYITVSTHTAASKHLNMQTAADAVPIPLYSASDGPNGSQSYFTITYLSPHLHHSHYSLSTPSSSALCLLGRGVTAAAVRSCHRRWCDPAASHYAWAAAHVMFAPAARINNVTSHILGHGDLTFGWQSALCTPHTSRVLQPAARPGPCGVRCLSRAGFLITFTKSKSLYITTHHCQPRNVTACFLS